MRVNILSLSADIYQLVIGGKTNTVYIRFIFKMTICNMWEGGRYPSLSVFFNLHCFFIILQVQVRGI